MDDYKARFDNPLQRFGIISMIRALVGKRLNKNPSGVFFSIRRLCTLLLSGRINDGDYDLLLWDGRTLGK